MSTDQRETLLTHAHDLVVQFGPRAFSFQALAARAEAPLDSVYDVFLDENEVLRTLALRGAADQRSRVVAAVSGITDPTEQLVGVVRSVIRSASEENWLFEIHAMRDVGVNKTAEYAAYAIEIHSALVASARAFVDNSDEGFDLLIRLIASARGIAELRQSGMLATGQDSVADAETQGERMARALIRDAQATSCGRDSPRAGRVVHHDASAPVNRPGQ